jgi:transcription factor TFIIIB component B''
MFILVFVRAHEGMSCRDQGPRVEIIDGKIVLKESSLTIDSGTSAAEFEYEEVVEGVGGNSRYSSYINRKASHVWGLEETRMFYQALRQCGTEFSMMQSFFPHRSRRELKLKFRRLAAFYLCCSVAD